MNDHYCNPHFYRLLEEIPGGPFYMCTNCGDVVYEIDWKEALIQVCDPHEHERVEYSGPEIFICVHCRQVVSTPSKIAVETGVHPETKTEYLELEDKS